MRNAIIWICTVILFIACGTDDDRSEALDRVVERKIMCCAVQNPDSGLILINNLEQKGEISQGYAAYLRAAVNFEIKGNGTGSLALCDKILKTKDADTNDSLRADLLVLKSDIAFSLDHISDMEYFAKDASLLCEQLGMPYAAKKAEMDCLVGGARAVVDQDKSGLALMEYSLNQLSNMDNIVSVMIYVRCCQAAAAAYNDMEQHKNSLIVLNKALKRLGDILKPSSKIEVGRDFENNKAGITRFVEKSKSELYARLASTHAMMKDEAKTREMLANYNVSEYGKKHPYEPHLMEAYSFLKMYDALDSVAKYITESKGADTPCMQNMRINNLLAQAAVEQGDATAASVYYNKSANLSKQITEIGNKNQLEYLSNKNRQSQGEVQKRTTEANRYIWILATVCIVFTVICVTAYYFYRLRKQEMNAVISRNIIDRYSESSIGSSVDDGTVPHGNNSGSTDLEGAGDGTDAINNEESIAAKNLAADKGMYDLIMDVMRTKKPYEDPNFDFDRLVNLVNSNRTYVSRSINTVYGKNFRSWLADYRNAVVVKMLKANPHTEVQVLVHRSGFSSTDALTRQFRKINGLSLAEFRAQMLD